MTVPDWMLDKGGDAQFIVFFIAFGLLAATELVWPAVKRKNFRRRWWTNIGLTLINMVALGALPVTLLTAAMWSQEHRVGILHHVELQAATVVVVTLLARGLVSFLVHLMMHKVPLLWRLHRVHHLDEEIDVSTTVRLHPAEFFVGVLPGALIVAGLGLSPWVLVAYEILDVLITLFSHANILLPARLDKVLSRIVVTPNLHRVHHSAHMPETDSNFSAVFPVWDMIFGTYRRLDKDQLEALALGLDDHSGRYREGLGRALIEPAVYRRI